MRHLFLAVLARTGSAQRAADAVAQPVDAAFALRARDARFDSGWDTAITTGIARLREVALDRALNGVARPAAKGGTDGEAMVVSDALLLGLLRLYDAPERRAPPPAPVSSVTRADLMAKLEAVAKAAERSTG